MLGLPVQKGTACAPNNMAFFKEGKRSPGCLSKSISLRMKEGIWLAPGRQFGCGHPVRRLEGNVCLCVCGVGMGSWSVNRNHMMRLGLGSPRRGFELS